MQSEKINGIYKYMYLHMFMVSSFIDELHKFFKKSCF